MKKGVLNKTLFFSNNQCMSEINNKKNISKNKQNKKEKKTQEFITQNNNFLYAENNKNKTISDLILANVFVVLMISLSAFIPFLSFSLPFLVAIYFEVGLGLFVLKKEKGEYCKYEDLFVSIKKYLKILCVAIIKIILIGFYSLFLFVPGIVCFIKYSFTCFILAEDSEIDTKGILMLSSELTHGFKWKILFWELISLVSICIAMSLMFSVILIFDVFLNVPNIVYIVFVVASAIFDLVVLAIPMMQVVLADYFLLAKQQKQKVFN